MSVCPVVEGLSTPAGAGQRQPSFLSRIVDKCRFGLIIPSLLSASSSPGCRESRAARRRPGEAEGGWERPGVAGKQLWAARV